MEYSSVGQKNSNFDTRKSGVFGLVDMFGMIFLMEPHHLNRFGLRTITFVTFGTIPIAICDETSVGKNITWKLFITIMAISGISHL